MPPNDCIKADAVLCTDAFANDAVDKLEPAEPLAEALASASAGSSNAESIRTSKVDVAAADTIASDPIPVTVTWLSLTLLAPDADSE